MFQDTVKDSFDSVRGLSTNDILAALGLEKRRTLLDVVVPAAGVFVAGAVIGAGVALLLAPKSGREIRRDLKGSAKELTRHIGASAEEMVDEVRHAVLESDDHGAPKATEASNHVERKPEAPRAMPPVTK